MSSDWSVSGSSSPTCTPPNSSSSQLSAISSCSSQSRNSEPSNRPSTSQILKTWPETFQVPWEQMPQEIRSAIADGKRPKPVERRQMVQVLVDEMRRYEANPTRAQCLTVVRNIIRQYPKSFADIAPDGSLLCGGYTSLLIQLKNRIENVNRDGSFSFHRSSTAKRGPTDTYVCTRFQPELPPEETDDTVEQHRHRLEEIYRQEGSGRAERAEFKNLMELTFSLQRRHINTLPPPDIEDGKSKWPFLFTPRYIYAHFELHTDINVLRSLELSMEECGRAITEYFRGKPTNKNVKDILSNGEDNETALRVVQLLMAHFGEDITGLILLTVTSLPIDSAGPSHGGPSVSFGGPPEDQMSIAASGDGLSTSEDEDSAGLPPSGDVTAAESDLELSAMLARAAVSIWLEVTTPPSPEPSRQDDWFLGAGHGSQHRSAPVPFFPEVHEEVTKSWTAPFMARSRSSPSSILTTLDGGAARGYVDVSQVERAVVVHLCPQNAATWSNHPRLPSKACKLSAALAAKAYSAAGQTASALHAMAILQVHQAKALKAMHEGGTDPGLMQELRTATDFALRATKTE
ncbi:uncharacterized protein LOC132092841 [Carassius carassius]|uniref:uncharacterized protein LOC132092841 n=1 Tax=Carassius carassius TaxID=217509 RepID=UPI0028689632|nr:uncharacterized protein LOC132092841 [Carassius carassius]